jgi:hypothetical protein
MEPVVLIQIKAWLTLAVGALFLLQSTQVVTAMGGKLHDAGVVMAQLFGLVLLAVGWGMVVSPGKVPAGSEALALVASDIAALVLLVLATRRGVFGSLGYGLAAVYAASAMMFLYLYFL